MSLKFQILLKSISLSYSPQDPRGPLGFTDALGLSSHRGQRVASLQVTWNCHLYEGCLVDLLDHLLAADPFTED